MKIIGVDPGTNRIGVGVVEYKNDKFTYISSELLEIEKTKSQTEILVSIESFLIKKIKTYKPEYAGVETLFFMKNKKTAMSVAEARGVILKTLTSNNVLCKEIAPLEVKLFLTGYGRADKIAVSKMVGKFLKKDTSKMIDDETDALAIAISAALKVGRGLPSSKTQYQL